MTAVAESIADRVAAIDWTGVATSLDAQGFAKLPVIIDLAVRNQGGGAGEERVTARRRSALRAQALLAARLQERRDAGERHAGIDGGGEVGIVGRE